MNDGWILNWGILSASFAVLVFLGWRANRVVNTDDASGFLIAGRNLGPFVGAATIVATGFSGWGFMGSPGVAYKFGTIEILGNFMFAPAMVLAVLYFAQFIRRRADAMGSGTIPEYIAQLHGTGTAARLVQGVAAIITIILLLVFLTGQIKAVGLLGSTWLGINVEQAAALMIAVIVIYTMLGGLTAVAWADTLMISGMVIAVVVMMAQIFGDVTMSELTTALGSIDDELLNPTTSDPYGAAKSSVFLMMPYTFLWAAVLPYMAIRFMAIRPDVEMHRVAIWVAPLACLLSLVPIVGLYVRVKNPGLEHADQAMPYYLENFLTPAVGSLISLCILFAMKSTANSLLHTIASAASHDLRRSIFPSAVSNSARSVLWSHRIAVAVLGFLGFLMMVYAPPVMLSWLGILGTGTLIAAFIGPVLISAIWRGNSYGALAAMLSGSCTSGGFLLFTNVGWVEGPLYGCVISSIAYFVVSLVTRKYV